MWNMKYNTHYELMEHERTITADTFAYFFFFFGRICQVSSLMTLWNMEGPYLQIPLLCVWWNMQGIIHYEMIEHGMAITVDVYC